MQKVRVFQGIKQNTKQQKVFGLPKEHSKKIIENLTILILLITPFGQKKNNIGQFMKIVEGDWGSHSTF